jgi:hypothetical protein
MNKLKIRSVLKKSEKFGLTGNQILFKIFLNYESNYNYIYRAINDFFYL